LSQNVSSQPEIYNGAQYQTGKSVFTLQLSPGRLRYPNRCHHHYSICAGAMTGCEDTKS